jgi:hypothetical protein
MSGFRFMVFRLRSSSFAGKLWGQARFKVKSSELDTPKHGHRISRRWLKEANSPELSLTRLNSRTEIFLISGPKTQNAEFRMQTEDDDEDEDDSKAR